MKLQKLSLFGAVAGALMLTAVFAPKVSALPQKPIVYFNFETGTLTSVPAPGPGGRLASGRAGTELRRRLPFRRRRAAGLRRRAASRQAHQNARRVALRGRLAAVPGGR